MGGGPDKEHLLIVLWDPEPKHITAELKRRFPYFDITYVQLSMQSKPFADNSDQVSKGEFPAGPNPVVKAGRG